MKTLVEVESVSPDSPMFTARLWAVLPQTSVELSALIVPPRTEFGSRARRCRAGMNASLRCSAEWFGLKESKRGRNYRPVVAGTWRVGRQGTS